MHGRTTLILEEDEWRDREEAHHDRADRLTRDHRQRAANGEKHPVEDFLFTYYGYRPGLIRRWHPGRGVELRGAGGTERATWRWYSPGSTSDSLVVDHDGFAREKPELAGTIATMLTVTSRRQARFGCFGLHEWAMVYRSRRPRHDIPLRLGSSGTDAVVDAHELRCTHFDAFRFFTDDAAPRNEAPLTRDSQPVLEQSGCLHAGMDVYKWAVKLGPLVPSELVLDAFELAREIRVLDMQASPYDLRAWGVEPVRIESPEGKAEYVARQREFAARADGIRRALWRAWQPDQSTDMHSAHSAATPTEDP